MTPLTDKQEAACLACAAGISKTDAYLSAYPGTETWKRASVSRAASKLFKKPHVHARLRQLLDQVAQEALITGEKVVHQMEKIAFADIRTAFNPDGSMRSVTDWPDDLAVAVQSVKVTHTKTWSAVLDEEGNELRPGGDEYVSEVRFWNRTTVLEQLAKYHGLYEKDNLQREGGIPNWERIPVDVRDQIVERLRAITGREPRPELAGPADAGGGKQTTH